MDTRPKDLAFWEVALTGSNERALHRLGAEPVATPKRELGFSQAAIVHDPDGHATDLIQR